MGENLLDKKYNPNRKNKDIGMGMSKSIPPSNIPSTVGSGFNSNVAEAGNLLFKKDDKK